MVIMLGSYVLFRQIYLYVMTNFISNTVMSVAFGYPLGWIVCSTAMILYYLRHPLRRVGLGKLLPPPQKRKPRKKRIPPPRIDPFPVYTAKAASLPNLFGGDGFSLLPRQSCSALKSGKTRKSLWKIKRK